MNVSFHVLGEILHAFDEGTEGALMEKFSGRYDRDIELQKINRLYQEYLKDQSNEKLQSIRKKLEELYASRKFESSGAKELPLTDRRKSSFKKFYEHEEK